MGPFLQSSEEEPGCVAHTGRGWYLNVPSCYTAAPTRAYVAACGFGKDLLSSDLISAFVLSHFALK